MMTLEDKKAGVSGLQPNTYLSSSKVLFECSTD
jgi:hypothetical protein